VQRTPVSLSFSDPAQSVCFEGATVRVPNRPCDPALAQQQADSLNGNALRSLQQFKNTLVHAVWYVACVKDAVP
jgi:hypothetical protein